MKIILTARVSGLGKVGDVVEVKNGYAKNFLIPSGKAICMTKNNERIFAANKEKFEQANENARKAAEEAKTKLVAQNIVIIENASDDGRLYGSVSSALIAEKINAILGAETIAKNDVILEKPIKEVGVYAVNIDLHSDTVFSVKTVVSRSESEVDAVIKADEKAKKDAAKAIEKEKAEAEAALEAKKKAAEAQEAAASAESEENSEKKAEGEEATAS